MNIGKLAEDSKDTPHVWRECMYVGQAARNAPVEVVCPVCDQHVLVHEWILREGGRVICNGSKTRNETREQADAHKATVAAIRQLVQDYGWLLPREETVGASRTAQEARQYNDW